MREYAFELALCRHLEARKTAVLSRQLGASVAGRRVMDVVVVSPGPAFETRREITSQTIPPAAIESDIGPGEATDWQSALDCHPDRARAVVQQAIECGFFERERRGGQTLVRQTVRYPDWYGKLIGIENKPDLERPGDLERQLLTDVKLGLLDAVVLATASHVTGAHRNRIPDEVGIWRFDPASDRREVIREPTVLSPATPGIEILDRTSARVDIRVATPAEIERARTRLAERAYGKGWRTYDLPACARISPDETGLPHCPWKDRLVHPAVDCGECCEGYEPADPPEIDLRAVRAEYSPWDPDPPGTHRRQASLARYLE